MAGPTRLPVPLKTATLAAVLVFAWWVMAVHYAHGGQWTALYCNGSRFVFPPWLEQQEPIARDDSPIGYDGQIFHILAHRPWPLHDLLPYLEPQRLRYQRILIPVLAHTLALGQQGWIDFSYFAVILLTLAAGVYATARLAELRGASAWWGLAFLLLPSSLSSIDRMLVDGPLVAAVAGFAFCRETGRWRPAALLAAAAPFIRETGLFLPAAAALAAFAGGGLRPAARWLATAVPFGLWMAVLSPLKGGPAMTFAGPFRSVVRLLAQDFAMPVPGGLELLLRATALLALAALLTAAVAAIHQTWRQHNSLALGPRSALWICAALFAVAAGLTCHSDPRHAWDDFYAFGRVFSPIFLAVFLDWLEAGRPWSAALLMLAASARMALQFASPAFRILRGLAGA